MYYAMYFPKLQLASFAAVAVSAVLARPPPKEQVKELEILWDGRIPWDMELTAFDSYATSRYNAVYVLGAGQKWSEVLKFPGVIPSLFDRNQTYKAVEVTINDKSIFAPGGNPQNGFRRSELLPISNNGTDPTVQGITTFHVSLRPDANRSLNISHQYELVFIETNDFSSHVWTLKAGTPFGANPSTSPLTKYLRLEGSTANGKTADVLFRVPWEIKTWHNFAITTDWVNNKLWAYYSSGNEPLKKVVNMIDNDATGKGQAHIGVLKLPTSSTNPSQNGYQQENLHEGVIYGGVFAEKGDATLDA
ncbi:hypothetical protein BDZ91DRAFT_691645 [Kalaharituber pfeilii]|nr:hypothetical protein BDZ91DRAFT_691645 [Kalaharituber pfeilii]